MLYDFLLSLKSLEELDETEIGQGFLPYLKRLHPTSEVLVLAFGGMVSRLGFVLTSLQLGSEEIASIFAHSIPNPPQSVR